MAVKRKIIFDMETSDPDDILTLALLCDHPNVDLKAVTITPGSSEQCYVVFKILEYFRRNVPIGAFNIDHPMACVSAWHDKFFSQIGATWGATNNKISSPGWMVLEEFCGEDVTLLTGAPLKNLGALIEKSKKDWCFERWIAQGGFIGNNILNEADMLPKFQGKKTCATFNFNGDPKSALAALAEPRFKYKLLVPKNVCHNLLNAMTEELKELFLAGFMKTGRRSLKFMADHCPTGKLLHDPLALTYALHQGPSYNRLWVAPFREKGEWGCELDNQGKSSTQIVGLVEDYTERHRILYEGVTFR